MLAAFRVDAPMLSGGNPQTWHGWAHGIAFLRSLRQLLTATTLLGVMLIKNRFRSRGTAVIMVAQLPLFLLIASITSLGNTFNPFLCCASGWSRWARRRERYR